MAIVINTKEVIYMNEINHNYCDTILQNTRASGTIKNTVKGLIVDLHIEKGYLTKEEFINNYLNQFRHTYSPSSNNKKEYKQFLKDEIEYTTNLLENLKFAYRITGRKILDKED
jgi:hypothetical protein